MKQRVLRPIRTSEVGSGVVKVIWLAVIVPGKENHVDWPGANGPVPLIIMPASARLKLVNVTPALA